MRWRRSRDRGRRRGRSHRETGISLTSLMDILTCLLFFVLKSFVAGGEVTVPPPGLDLPKSTAERPMATSLVVAIDKGAILVGNERVATVQEAMAGEGLLIEPLAARLRAAHDQSEELARHRGAGAAPPQVVTVQGDETIEFRVLQKVMYTLDQGGYPDIALAVIKKA